MKKEKYYTTYRCPMCGKEFMRGACRVVDEMQIHKIFAKIIVNEFHANNPVYKILMHTPHNCDDGNVGIAQLIGFKKANEEEEKNEV